VRASLSLPATAVDREFDLCLNCVVAAAKHTKRRVLSCEGQEKLRLAGYAEWMKGVIPKHGEKFDYSRAKDQFKTQKKSLVEIRCAAHDEWFTTTPFDHLRSKNGGCRECDTADAVARFREKEGQKFLPWFAKNRADRLEIRSEFNGMTQPMEFLCMIHGTITSAKPTDVMSNKNCGCERCGREARGQQSRLDEQQVIAELSPALPDHVKILGVRFDEEKRQSLIEIDCERHGKRPVTKGYLTRSEHKCPDCGNEMIGYTGYRLQQLVAAGEEGTPALIGVMEVEAFGIRALKVGVTCRSLEQRYGYALKKIIFSVRASERAVYTLENRIYRDFRAEQDTRILNAGMREGERWDGDTECYWKRNEQLIIDYIKQFLAHLDEVNFEEEVKLYEIPDPFPRDTSREKDTSNLPCAIVGVDPATNEIKHEFISIAEAKRAGFSSVTVALTAPGRRGLSAGLRWFRKDDFRPDDIPPLPAKNNKTRAVRCVETGEVFQSIALAAAILRGKGALVSQPHITAVCQGKRAKAGGYGWAYADDEKG
jgi:hypothetical protein